MLNRILFILIFSCIVTVELIAMPDSIAFQKLNKEINVFKISNQKKILHARISKSISEFNQNFYNEGLSKLKYMYLQELLNNGFIDETFQILNQIKGSGQLKGNKDIADLWYWYGMSHRFNNDFDSALYYFNRALDNISFCNNDDLEGTIKYNIGKTYLRSGNRNAALPHFMKANELIKTNVYALAQSKRRISSTFSLCNDHKKALKYINEAIGLYTSFDNEFAHDSIVDYHEYADLLQSRAYVYRQMALKEEEPLFSLYKSLNDAVSSIFVFEKGKRKLVFESDIIYSNTLYKYFYSKTIEAISRITDINNSDSLIYQALQYAEMDKSSALLRSVQKNIALTKSNIPDSIVTHLNNLYWRLSEVEAKRFEVNANVRVNDTALYDLNMELFDLVSEITALEKQLEREYPIYAEEKYKVIPPNLNFILEQSYDKAILEYVVSNEKLYAFLIKDGKIYFHHFYYRDDFIESVEKLQQKIADLNNIDYSLEELNEFESISQQLYVDLLAPFDSLIGKQPLLIVPDEQLSLIPFEVLLTKPNKSKSINYASLPYLVKRNDVSYAYSLTLSYKQNIIERNYTHDKVLAMAPTYEGLAGNQGSQYIALRSAFREARDELGMLEGARKEAKQISKNIKSALYLDNEASEEHFKQNAPNYKVLHLAMHTLINNEDPLYSKLVFTPDADMNDDGLLNTYELNNMKLNAELVVLSACNTGFGKLNKGEGIIGLTRGFLQAGCKSLLATLWSVADEASADLIEAFYNGLKKGYSKSRSLSEAKRKYLEISTGRIAHPFFWAAYISIGDDSPVELKAKRNLYWHLILPAIVILLVLLYRKSRS